MKKNPGEPWGKEQQASEVCEQHTDAVDFMVTMIGATICSSGQDYNQAIERFFPQLQALGELIEVSSLDDISACLRGTYSPG